jgi:hypothetical protein
VKYHKRSVMWIGAFSSVVAVLAIVTLLWRDWIEQAFGIDPDRHTGSIEGQLVVALLLVAMLFAALARRDWHRASFAGTLGTRSAETSTIR